MNAHAERRVNDEQRRQQGDSGGRQGLARDHFGRGAAFDFRLDVGERLQFERRVRRRQVAAQRR